MAVVFSREINPIAKNQVIIEMQLIRDLVICNFKLFVFNLTNFFFNKKGKKITKPSKQRKKEITNVCKSIDKRHASILRLKDDSWEYVARGVRNSVGFDFHPISKKLYLCRWQKGCCCD